MRREGASDNGGVSYNAAGGSPSKLDTQGGEAECEVESAVSPAALSAISLSAEHISVNFLKTDS